VNVSSGLLWLLLLLTAGCERGDRATFGGEVNDPYYQRGKELLRQGRNQEALGAFLKVVDKRSDDAPESHLEAGLLYQQYLKDPIAAIYHFRKYLELQPNSRQADLVRQRIDAAMREFARSLPAQPLESQTARLEFMTRIDALQKENLQLKEELTTLHQGRPSATGSGGAPPLETTPPPPITRLPRPSPTNAGASATVTRPPQAVRPPATAASNPAPAAGRRHVVAPGETLYKIAQRYYGSGAKWPQILEANRDVLKNENAVRAGMELRIP
jgi:tetratricopeptide (TPR) repeat protein